MRADLTFNSENVNETKAESRSEPPPPLISRTAEPGKAVSKQRNRTRRGTGYVGQADEGHSDRHDYEKQTEQRAETGIDRDEREERADQ